MLFSGIDEAGLGPILGPYCATATTFKSDSDIKELVKDAPRSLFFVDDSKKVYKGTKGFYNLEINVLSFYYLLYKKLPKTSLEFIPTLQSDWNLENRVKLPVEANIKEIEDRALNIQKYFLDKNIHLIDIKRTAISPFNFNRLIDTYSNKSTVCQKILEPLIKNILLDKNNHYIVIDKQGGRKFYKEYLDNISNMNFNINKEEDNHSSYSSSNTKIDFKAKADSTSFEVALASMISKYMREISMLSFNMYWQSRLPMLSKTAGYYVDGQRFIKEIINLPDFPKEIDLIIRKK